MHLGLLTRLVALPRNKGSREGRRRGRREATTMGKAGRREGNEAGCPRDASYVARRMGEGVEGKLEKGWGQPVRCKHGCRRVDVEEETGQASRFPGEPAH